MSSRYIGGEAELTENVEQLRARLEAMKRLMADNEKDGRNSSKSEGVDFVGKLSGKNKDSIIDGSFLSFVFGVVLLMIICVSIYAFQNLYYAILKKFPSRHTEL